MTRRLWQRTAFFPDAVGEERCHLRVVEDLAQLGLIAAHVAVDVGVVEEDRFDYPEAWRITGVVKRLQLKVQLLACAGVIVRIAVPKELLSRVPWEVIRLVADPHAHRPRARVAVVDVGEREGVLQNGRYVALGVPLNVAALDDAAKDVVVDPVGLVVHANVVGDRSSSVVEDHAAAAVVDALEARHRLLELVAVAVIQVVVPVARGGGWVRDVGWQTGSHALFEVCCSRRHSTSASGGRMPFGMSTGVTRRLYRLT